MALPDVSVGGTGHVTHHNILHNATQFEQFQRWVETASRGGSDSNDGRTPFEPKATVAAAINSLPVDSGGFHIGKVNVGRGTFVETATPIIVKGGLWIAGSGVGPTGQEATVIQLADSRNTHLFEMTTLTANNHGFQMSNLRLDGNKANQTAGSDANCFVFAGGYNSILYNLYVQNATKWGFHMEGAPQNIQMFDITAAGCGTATQGGFMHYLGLDGGTFSLDGFQLDVCGKYPFFWEHTFTSAGHTAVFRNGKVEQQDADTSLHENVFRMKPRTSAGGNPPNYTLHNIFINHNSGSTDQHPAAVYEESQAGVGAMFDIQSLYTNGPYQKAFTSAKTGRSSMGKYIRRLMDTDSATTRAIEMDGVVLSAGTGAPSGSDGLPIGSMYLRRDGGTSTTLYIKEGASTWVAK